MPDQAGVMSQALYGQSLNQLLDLTFTMPSYANMNTVSNCYFTFSTALATPQYVFSFLTRASSVGSSIVFTAQARSRAGTYNARLQLYINGSPYGSYVQTLSTSYTWLNPSIPASIPAGTSIALYGWIENVADIIDINGFAYTFSQTSPARHTLAWPSIFFAKL